MNLLTKWSLYSLSIALAFGTIDPFNVGLSAEERTEPFFTTLFAGFFVFFSFVKYKFSIFQVKASRNLIAPLLLLILFLLTSDFIYDYTNVAWFFIAKLLFAIIALGYLMRYYCDNPQIIKTSLIIFSTACAIIILLVHVGFWGTEVTYSKGRIFIMGENPNSTSSRMVIATIFLIYSFMTTLQKKQLKTFLMKWFFYTLYLTPIILLTIYIIQSGSRGSFLSLLLGISILFFFQGKKRLSFYLFLISGVALLFYLLSYLERTSDISLFERMNEMKNNERITLMQEAISIFEDNPLLGVGSSGYQKEKLIRGFTNKDSHNILTSIMAMGGVLGLFAYLTFLYRLLRLEVKTLQISPLPFSISACMFLMSLKTGGVITFMLMWYMYAVSAAISEVEMKKKLNW